jgi:hypothetical protein
LLRRRYGINGVILAKCVLLPNSGGGVWRELPPINSFHRGCIKQTDALSCRRLDGGSVQMIGRVSVLTQAISLVLLCLGVAAFVADSALGPPMLATAIAAWLIMPDPLMHR